MEPVECKKIPKWLQIITAILAQFDKYDAIDKQRSPQIAHTGHFHAEYIWPRAHVNARLGVSRWSFSTSALAFPLLMLVLSFETPEKYAYKEGVNSDLLTASSNRDRVVCAMRALCRAIWGKRKGGIFSRVLTAVTVDMGPSGFERFPADLVSNSQRK